MHHRRTRQPARLTRALAVGVAAAVAAVAAGLGITAAGPAAASDRTQRDIDRAVRTAMTEQGLRAVIVRVTRGDRVVANRAFGESLPGVPATTQMRFRNGAVAFSYVSMLLLRYVDRGLVRLDDPVHRWLPKLPLSRQVTLKMLANQTSGYPDYETDATFVEAFERNPFRRFSYGYRLRVAFSRPQLFPPGTNWSYAHTNFMVLGRILSQVGGAPLRVLLGREVLRPLGLDQTVASQTGAIPSPVLHAFSSERRSYLGVPAGRPFIEESTFWNSAWGTPVGATQTSTVRDLARTAVAFGTGELLSRRSFRAMTGPNLLGFGEPLPQCVPSCFRQVRGYNYGLGLVRSGRWLLQNPLLGGYSATTAYLPRKKISIAVAATFLPSGFSPEGGYGNAADQLFRTIGAIVAPNSPPPVKR